MNHKIEMNNKVAVMSLEGNILSDSDTKTALENVNEKIQEGHTKFAVDLSNLKFINSTGLSFLLIILTKTRKAGGETILCNIPEQLSKLLVMTKLNNVFTVTNSTIEAVSKLK